MAKITKHAAFLEQLHGMVTKEATAGKATGKPGGDTNPVSVSESTEHVNKNEEGHPEHNPQEFKQEKASDPSDPTKAHHKKAEAAPGTTALGSSSAPEAKAPATPAPEAVKSAEVDPKVVSNAPAKHGEEAPNKVEQKLAKSAEEAPTNEKLAELGKQLLTALDTMQKQAKAGTATGKPGGDTHPVSVSESTDHVNKNEEGHPEHNPQEFKQEKAKDPSDPTKGGHKDKKAEEQADLDKEASFELGRQFARTFLTSKTAASVDVYKEAGRRDFETLIAQAASELDLEQPAPTAPTAVAKVAEDNTKVAEEEQIKQAEEAGAQAFYTMLKQAQDEEKANQVKAAFDQRVNQILAEKKAAEEKAAQLAAKVAEFETNIQKQAEEAKLEAKFATWGSRIVDETISRLKNEPIPSR